MEDDWKFMFTLTCNICGSNNTEIIYFPKNHFEYGKLVFQCDDCDQEMEIDI
jgi:hypothetical protein